MKSHSMSSSILTIPPIVSHISQIMSIWFLKHVNLLSIVVHCDSLTRYVTMTTLYVLKFLKSNELKTTFLCTLDEVTCYWIALVCLVITKVLDIEQKIPTWNQISPNVPYSIWNVPIAPFPICHSLLV